MKKRPFFKTTGLLLILFMCIGLFGSCAKKTRTDEDSFIEKWKDLAEESKATAPSAVKREVDPEKPEEPAAAAETKIPEPERQLPQQ